MYWPNLKSVALSIPEIMAIGVLGEVWVANLQSRERRCRGSAWNGTMSTIR